MFVGDVEFADCWDLDFRNCNLLKGGPPSTLLSSAKFVILQIAWNILEYYRIPAKNHANIALQLQSFECIQIDVDEKLGGKKHLNPTISLESHDSFSAIIAGHHSVWNEEWHGQTN